MPYTLPENYVSIYGMASIAGIAPILNGYQFGYVTSIYGAGAGSYVGTNVMFALSNSVPISYGNAQYFLLPTENIILTETPPT